MKLKNEALWHIYVTANRDAYGGCCVSVARRVMEILDEGAPIESCRRLICRADDEAQTGGITGFMASAVAQMVSECHERGEEFRRAWNSENQLAGEGDAANESGDVLNIALLTQTGAPS